jgi:thiol-disulfide isomerase/thioredoxin
MIRVSTIAGALVLALTATTALHDALVVVLHFERMGPLVPGRDVPPFVVPLAEGNFFSEDELLGRVHVVTFWAVSCSECRDELDELAPLARSYDDAEVRIVAVNRDATGVDRGDVVSMSKRYPGAEQPGLALAFDGWPMAESFGVGPLPYTVVFDRHGEVRSAHEGRVGSAAIARAIDALLAEH